MKRRSFLKNISLASLAPVALENTTVQALQNSRLAQLLAMAGSDCDDRVLVMIQLNGGNDGLNTIIPIDRYDKLAPARPKLLIPENKVLSMTGNDTLGFHPSMTGIRNLWDNDEVSIVQNVGYPNQDFSHFRSTDIWLSASGADEAVPTGWIGRYLEQDHPDYPDGYPSEENPDPLAVQVGVVMSPVTLGSQTNMGMAITNPDDFYQLVTDTDDTPDDTPANHELRFIRQTARQTNAYADSIIGAAQNATNLSTKYPDGNKLAEDLKIVARLIAGGMKTKMYLVQLGGFDTHSKQIEGSDSTTGEHAMLLKTLSDAVEAFQDDLQLLGKKDKVLSMTFSEFGRRITENGSDGTDHGAAAPIMFFGEAFGSKVIGANPILPDNPSVNDNIPLEFDYRSVYATVLRDWFCVPEDKVKEILFDDYQYLPLLETSVASEELTQLQVFPVPASDNLQVKFYSSERSANIELYDPMGKRVLSQRQVLTGGTNQLQLSVGGLENGHYILRVATYKNTLTKPIVVMR